MSEEKENKQAYSYVQDFLKWGVVILLGIVSYFLQRTNNQFEQAQKTMDARIELQQNTINALQLRDVNNANMNTYLQERIRGLEAGREENRKRIEDLEKQLIRLNR